MKLFWKTKPKDISIAVVGNCQARPLAQIISAICSQINIKSVGIVHLLKNEEKKTYESQFEYADFIFAQRVADNYPCSFIRTNELKRKWGDKVIVWPNIYFRGYNPELIYVRTDDGKPLGGPMGDYHSRTFIESWANGLNRIQTLDLHRDIQYNGEKYDGILEHSLLELKEREVDCDIRISNYIEKELSLRRLFFTFNHPTYELLWCAAKQLLDLSDIRYDRIDNRNYPEPLGQLYPPVNRWAFQKYGFKFNESSIWNGLNVRKIKRNIITTGGKQAFTDEEIIDIFFKIYADNQDSVSRFLKI